MKKVILYIIIVLAALTFLYPFIWMVSASISPEKEIGGLILLPSYFTLDSYVQMMSKIPIGKAFINSMIVECSITIGVLIFGSIVGYALSKLEFKGRDTIFYLIIFTMTLPSFGLYPVEIVRLPSFPMAF